MFKAIAVLAISIVIYKLDFASVKETKSKWDNKVYNIFFLITFCLFMLYMFDVKIPSPLEPIKQIYKPIIDPFNQLLMKYKIE